MSSGEGAGRQLPFKYVGGNPAVDLVNTVDYTSRGLENERLTDYSRITRWAEGAGVLPARVGAGLRKQAVARPEQAGLAFRAVVRAREMLHRLFGELAEGKASPGALGQFNRLLGPALEHLRVISDPGRGGGSHLELGWEELSQRLDAVLWPVLWSAATLISSEEAAKIRICGGEDCGWMYVDRSRNGLRRWCQMEVCGTREKTRRRRQTIS